MATASILMAPAVSVFPDDLDYHGIAQITTKQGFFTNAFGRMSGGKLVDGKLTFPFRISGSIENPVFSKGEADK